MTPVDWILATIVGYSVVGVAFAGVFLGLGARRVDPAVRGSHPLFYVAVFPGIAALWPVMAVKWWGGRRDTGREVTVSGSRERAA